MNKYGIILFEKLTGHFVVLGVKVVEGKHTLSTDKDATTFSIDNIRMVDEARLSKGDGSMYRPINNFDTDLLQVAKIETKTVIDSVTPVKYQSPVNLSKAS